MEVGGCATGIAVLQLDGRAFDQDRSMHPVQYSPSALS
jgi:hypothetical protein